MPQWTQRGQQWSSIWSLGSRWPLASQQRSGMDTATGISFDYVILSMSIQEPIDWRYLPYIRPIFQAYVREYSPKIWPYMVQYLHFRILNFPLILPWGCFFFFPCWLLTNPSYWSEIWPKVFSNCCVWPDSVTHQNGLCINSSWNHQSHLEVDVMLAPGNPWHDVSIYIYTSIHTIAICQFNI